MKTLGMREKRKIINGCIPAELLISQQLFIIHFKTLYQTKAQIMFLDLSIHAYY